MKNIMFEQDLDIKVFTLKNGKTMLGHVDDLNNGLEFYLVRWPRIVDDLSLTTLSNSNVLAGENIILFTSSIIYLGYPNTYWRNQYVKMWQGVKEWERNNS